MQKVEWTAECELGIGVIDGQHKRIVDYIYSHFAFEEALMEEAGYEQLNFHQQTHEVFTNRIRDLHRRFCEGEKVNEEIGELLKNWLLNHIKEDDRSYAPLVKKNLAENKGKGNWITNSIRRFF
jgi:hemerythrin